MLEDLRQRVEQLLEKKDHIVVGISGFGGSGKTYLAELLKNSFSGSSTWVQLDNFLVDHGQGKGWAGGYDWNRFESVLRDIAAGKDLHYQAYDWDKNALTDWYIDEKLPRVIVVEGVRLFHPRISRYFDLKVWVDRSLENATDSGKQRDRANGADDVHIKLWDDVWTPKEKEFIEEFNPRAQADYLYKF